MHRIMQVNVEDLISPNLWLSLSAEFTGTLAITLFGCGAWLTNADVIKVALTFGLVVATVVWVFHHISGGYFNPAVTIGAVLTCRVSIVRGVLYVIVQLAGAISGAGILSRLAPSGLQWNLGANSLTANVTLAQGFLVEFLTTFVYALTVSASQDEKRLDPKGPAPSTIGFAVVACHLFAVPYTMAGLNPARSLGPALVANVWNDHWVFWIGPVAGAIVAALLYKYVFAAGASFDGVTRCLRRSKKSSKQPEQEKAPLEEVKEAVIEIDESTVEGDNVGGATADAEQGK